MIKLENNKKGIILFIVLGTILIVTILANVIIGIMLSQSRLTHHQVSRIQAYYAAWAGINMAYEKVRTNSPGWPIPPATSSYSQPVPDNWPRAVQSVTVTVYGRSRCPNPNPPPTYITPPTGVEACINATVNYTRR